MTKKIKKLLSVALCAALIASSTQAVAYARVLDSISGGDYAEGLCPHHTRHDENCGYQEYVPPHACEHEHDESCYDYVTESDSNAHESDNDAEKNGELKLNCKHKHDESCGYSEGKEARPCKFNCPYCGNIFYVDEDGDGQRANATQLTPDTGDAATVLNGGWYYVDGTVNFSGSKDGRKGLVRVDGDVNLILTDGSTLNADRGIEVPEGSSLTIYGQDGNSGRLNAKSNSSNAAIGGRASGSEANGTGDITIVGGRVTAKIGEGAVATGAAIGSGYANNGSSPHITILGGIVEADAGSSVGAGIGGYGATVEIKGGDVTARGGYINGDYQQAGGAGIGNAGGNGAECDVLISGGSVTAKGGRGADGIGRNGSGFGGDVTITGGSVTASGDSAAISGIDLSDAWDGNDGYIVFGSESLQDPSGLVAVNADGISGAIGSDAGLYKYLRIEPANIDAVGVTPESVSASAGNEIRYAVSITKGSHSGSEITPFLSNVTWSVYTPDAGRSISPNTWVGSDGVLHIGGDEKLYDLVVEATMGLPDAIEVTNSTASVSVRQKGYTVSFDANGGVASAATLGTRYGLIDGAIPTAKRDGYTFKGWFTEKIDGDLAADFAGKTPVDGNTVFDGDTTVYAGWQANEYTVTFDTMGGSMKNFTLKVLYGRKVGAPATMESEYKLFDGWYTDQEYSHKWNFDSETVTGDMTLYAKWKDADIAIMGTASPSYGGKVLNSGIFRVGAKVTLVAEPAEGYRFLYWREYGRKISYSATLDITVSYERHIVAVFARRPADSTESGNGSGGGSGSWNGSGSGSGSSSGTWNGSGSGSGSWNGSGSGSGSSSGSWNNSGSGSGSYNDDDSDSYNDSGSSGSGSGSSQNGGSTSSSSWNRGESSGVGPGYGYSNAGPGAGSGSGADAGSNAGADSGSSSAAGSASVAVSGSAAASGSSEGNGANASAGSGNTGADTAPAYIPQAIPGSGVKATMVVNTVADAQADGTVGVAETNSGLQLVGGSWTQNGDGSWVLNYSDGTKATDSWVCVKEADGNHWYHFNKDGLMDSGWINIDGKIYFLHDVHDGTAGRMHTGWQLIDKKWYYFSAKEDETLGQLLTNTITPDGYHVNEKGEWSM